MCKCSHTSKSLALSSKALGSRWKKVYRIQQMECIGETCKQKTIQSHHFSQIMSENVSIYTLNIDGICCRSLVVDFSLVKKKLCQRELINGRCSHSPGIANHFKSATNLINFLSTATLIDVDSMIVWTKKKKIPQAFSKYRRFSPSNHRIHDCCFIYSWFVVFCEKKNCVLINHGNAKYDVWNGL